MVVAQSGGPTAVVNASIVGALRAAKANGRVERVLGARFGFEGILAGDYSELDPLSETEIARLARTPGAGLGSSRHRPTEDELERTLDNLGTLGVRWLAIVGGNDTADALHRLHNAASDRGQSLSVVGIPKTIDNDLPCMDHAPGYGSAARFLALAARETALDTAGMQRTDPIKVLEVMGRNAGWLAASTALAASAGQPPDVIFLPERARSLAQMLEEIGAVHGSRGWALVVISENQCDDSGRPLAGEAALHVDAYGHGYHESPGLYLARAVQQELGLRARYERPGSLQRTWTATISDVDVEEAAAAGAEAARLAIAGESDVMVTIERVSNKPYGVRFGTAPLERIAHQERLLPDQFIAASGIGVTEAFIEYARPLIGGELPPVELLR